MRTFTGLEYLKIDIANNFGLDKLDWNDRLAWFEQNRNQLDTLVKQAEEPALFYAGVQAYKKALKGEASGYPISLDATSSGIQILACLTGDRKAAELCNVVSTGHREDAYTRLYETMVGEIGEAAKIGRKETKQAIMTAFYGSTAMPRNIFGEGELLRCFYQTMESQAPGCWELNQTMLAIWDKTALKNAWVMPDNFHVEVKVMAQVYENVHFLNKPYEVTYRVNAPVKESRSLGANMVHSIDGMIVREMARRCDFNIEKVDQIQHWLDCGAKGGKSNRKKDDLLVIELCELAEESKFLSARILSYLSLDNLGHLSAEVRGLLAGLIHSLPETPFQILTVHDCFRCLPNHGNDLRQQYNNCLMEVARSELLSFLLTQIMKRHVPVSKLDPDLWKDIAESDYALS